MGKIPTERKKSIKVKLKFKKKSKIVRKEKDQQTQAKWGQHENQATDWDSWGLTEINEPVGA